MTSRRTGPIGLLLLLVAASVPAADWHLANDQSSLGFISLKNVDVAEAHRFTELAGSIDAGGAFQLTIAAASVDTKIPIRDERMREHVLDAPEYPVARARGRADPAAFAELKNGETASTEVRAELDFRGQKTPLAVQVQISRVGEDALQVTSLAPILLNAQTLGVADGVEALREIAGLQSISMAVPVYFSLRFERAD